MLFECLEEHFGGLGGSWEQVEILMDSGILHGDHLGPPRGEGTEAARLKPHTVGA